MDRDKPIISRKRAAGDRAGFGVAPILYMLGLIGVGAGVLFSSYSQSIKNNVQLTNSFAVKSDLDAAATTLAATSVLGSTDTGTLCPPQGGIDTTGSNCATAPDKMTEIYPNMNVTTPDPHLPATYGVPQTGGSPVEVGIFTSGSGIKQIDPWGHYYIYCRWENESTSSSPAIQILSAGSTGVFNTKCGASTASTSPDNYMVYMNAANAVNRSAVWQTGTVSGSSTPDVYYGTTGHQLTVDANGNLTVPGDITAGGNYSSPGNVAVSGAVSGASGAFVGNVSANGGAFTTGSGGTISAASGAFTLGSGGIVSAASGAFSVASGGALNAANGAFSVSSYGGLAIGSSEFTVAASNGAVSAAGPVTLGSTLATSGAANIGNTVPATGVSAPLLSVGLKVGLNYPFAVDQAGNVTATSFNGTLNGSVNGGSVSATSITDSGNIAVTGNYTSSAGNITLTGGTVTAANFVGNIAIGSGGGGATISGVIPIANGGTGANNATSALANLGVTSGGYLSTSLLTTGLIPGADIVSHSVTISQLDQVASSYAGSYNWGTITADGRVTFAQNVGTTSNGITDGSGDSVTVGSSAINFTVGSSVRGVWNSTGLMVGTNSPTAKDKLDVYGSVALGTGYAGVYTAPANGLIVAGSTGIGTSNPVSALQVVGTVTATSFSGSGAGLTGIGTSSISGTIGTGNGGTGTSTTFTPGSVVFAGTGGVYTQNNANFFWDNTNNRLGIGTSAPGYPLQINGSGATSQLVISNNTIGWGLRSDASSSFIIRETGVADFLTILPASGNVGIGTTLPGATLQVTQSSPGSVGMIVQAASSETADLQDWLNSSGGTIGSINSAGSMSVPNGFTGGSFMQSGGIGRINYLGMTIGSNSVLGFSSAGNVQNGTLDTALSRVSAGTLAVGNGTVGNATGTLLAGSVGIGSTSPTVSLDLSQKSDAIALPSGGNSTRPSGANLVNGDLRYNSSTPGLEAYVNGAWTTLLNSGSSSPGASAYLGASASATNPSRSATELNTGLYSANSGEVDVASLGTQIAKISSAGIGIVAGGLNIGTTTGAVAGGLQTIGSAVIGSTSMPATMQVIGSSLASNVGAKFLSSNEILVSDYTNTGNGLAIGFDPTIGTGYTTGGSASGTGSGFIQPGGFISAGRGGGGSNLVYPLLLNPQGITPVGIGTMLPSASAAFDVEGAAKYVLLNSGNVGVGTTIPSNQLQVYSSLPGIDITASGTGNRSTLGLYNSNGGVHLGKDNSAGNAFVSSGPANAGLLYTDSSVPLWFGTGTQIRMLIDTSGNVGIGSTSPLVSLDLSQKTDAVSLPAGATSARPTGVNGMIRYNTTLVGLEAYINNSWTTLLNNGSGISGGVYLGSSSAAANPARSATELNTGLYSANSGEVDIAGLGTQLMSITSTKTLIPVGSVAIATSTPVSALSINATDNISSISVPVQSVLNVATVSAHVDNTYTATTVAAPTGNLQTNGNLDNLTFNPMGTSFNGLVINNQAVTTIPATNSVAATNSIMGYKAMTVNQGTGFAGNLYGMEAFAENTGATSYQSAVGLYALAGNAGNGNAASTAASVSSIYGFSVNNSSNSTITSQYGIYANALNVGTITNGYGLYISGEGSGGTWTNMPYDIYASDTTAVNYLANKLGIGSTLPAVSLDLSQETDAVSLPAGATSARPTGVNGMIRYNTTLAGMEAYINGAWATLLNNGSGGSGITLGTALTALNPTKSGDTATGLYSDATSTVEIAGGGSKIASFSPTITSIAIGSVGIGTASPGGALDIHTGAPTDIVFGVSSGYNIMALNGAGPASNFLGIVGGGTGDSNLYLDADSSSGSLVFRTNNYAQRMLINAAGNVGIGTTNPNTQLAIWGSGQTTANMTTASGLGGAIALNDTGNAINNGGAVLFGAGNATGSAPVNFAAIKGLVVDGSNNGAGHLAFSTRNASSDTTLTERMRITNAGLVGIGSTIPNASLDLSQKTDAVSLPSGATSARPTGVNGMIRYNTTIPGVEAYVNNAWTTLSGGSSSGSITLGTALTALNPTKSGDTNTGLYSDATSTVEIAGGGSKIASFSPTVTSIAIGLVGIGSTIPDASLDLSQKTDAVSLPAGATSARPTGVNGMIRYNTTIPGVEAFVNGSWTTLSGGGGGGGSSSLSSLTAATATNTIDNTNYAQVWNWSTLSTQTGLTLANTGASASASNVLSVTTNSTGASSAISASNTGTSNTGYAGYFSNNSATGWGVYSAGTSPSYFGGNVDIGTQALVTEITNAASPGTTVNYLAKLSSTGGALATTTSDTDGAVGVVVGGAGTTGNAKVATDGQSSCAFDGATTAGDYVIPSTTTAGKCHDAGGVRPTSAQTIGRVLTTNSAAGTFGMIMALGKANNIQAPVTATATSGASCSTVGALAQDSSGHLMVCDNSPSTLAGTACSSFGSGALSFNSTGVTFLCLQ